MSHVSKRLASTATKFATIPPSQLKAFPPKEALAYRSKPSSSKTDSPKTAHTPTDAPTFFDTDTWAALQPPNPAAFSAFAHRIGLGNVLPDPVKTVQQACTHPSYLPFHAKHRPDERAPPANGNLEAVGNSLLGLFATEYVNSTYPHLPTKVLKAAVSAYVGPSTCASIAKEMGATPLLRWTRTPNTPVKAAVLHSDVLSSVPRALTALVYEHGSLLSARRFAHKFFLSRDVDIRSMIKFRDPKITLQETVQKFGRERPVSRLLKETGRLSISPVFVVGIYSGPDQLGEGFGSSLKMAEYRAAEDALHRLYLTRQPPHLVKLPTSTFTDTPGTVFSARDEVSDYDYVPSEMSDAEILYGSAERSGLSKPGRRRAPEDSERRVQAN